MHADDLQQRLEFLRHAERLKLTTRTAWKSDGSRETVAEHTWRICLMAMVFRDALDGADLARVLQLLIVHDLGEAIGGDISAVVQAGQPSKAESERRDLLTLLEALPEGQRAYFVALWDEYEAAATPEAKLAKGFDKLETILQHNQGQGPADFDFAFNLDYARRHTEGVSLLRELREVLDDETRRRMTLPPA